MFVIRPLYSVYESGLCVVLGAEMGIHPKEQGRVAATLLGIFYIHDRMPVDSGYGIMGSWYHGDER